MKILIVFMTHNTGSSESYETTWRCIPENEDDGRREMPLDGEKKIYVFNGNEFYNSKGNEWEYQDIVKEIAEIVTAIEDDNAVFTLLFHASTDQKSMLCDELKKNEQIKSKINYSEWLVKKYSSAMDPTWDDHISKFCDTPEDTNDKFDSLWCFLWRNARLREAHSLFLPLDIDMQALEILAKKKENGVKIKNPKEYLEEIYADNIDYVQKLKELQAKVNTIGEIEGIDKERLEKIVGIGNENVDQFFEKLGGKKNDPDEFLGHSWGIDRVNSFHDWYCALSSCLRGAEGCEGK